MEKLELKHLALYLPYELKGLVFYTEEDFELISLSTKDGLEDEASINSWLTGYKSKPILRPLSDLTKEIEVNGELFVPLEKLESMFGDCTRLTDTMLVNSFTPFGIVQKLFEWHFDVFGLIEKGLAISYNDLNNEKNTIL